MDEYLFLHEELDLQQFQMESDMIIGDFILVIPPFDQEDDMLIIEDFCSNLENISSFESRDLNNESCFDKLLTVFSRNSKISQASRTFQPMLTVISGSCHHGGICDLGQFMFLWYLFIVNVITWDVDSLPRDAYFLYVKFFNPQGMKFNLTIEIPSLHPTSSKSLIYNVEKWKNLNEYFSSSIKESHGHDKLDFFYLLTLLMICICFCSAFPVYFSLKVVSMILLRTH